MTTRVAILGLSIVALLSGASAYSLRNARAQTEAPWKVLPSNSNPEFTIERDGSFLKLKHSDVLSKAPEKKAGKLEMASEKRLHRYYEINEGFEYEIEYAARPPSDIEILHLETSNDLDFFYQPPLTAAQIARGMERPENVIRSYAVYWKGPKNGTGKFGHIYRPLLKDAMGKTAWANMEINAAQKILKITMPKAWMDNATYPVILDPTFGHTSVGATSDSCPTNYICSLGTPSPATNGTLTSVSLWVRAGTTEGISATAGLYNDSSGPTTRVATSAAMTTAGTDNWQSMTFSGSPAVTAGTNYWIAWFANGTINTKVDSTAGWTDDAISDTYAAGNIPNPFPGGYTTYANTRISVYATYAEAATSSPIHIIILKALEKFIPVAFAK